jgi:hypothetical protein
MVEIIIPFKHVKTVIPLDKIQDLYLQESRFYNS